MRQFNSVVASPLRDPHNSLDLLDLLVIGGRRPVQVSGNLSPQIGIDNKRLENVFRHDKRQATDIVLDIVVGHVNVVDTKGQVGRRNGSDSPVRLGAKRLLLVVGRRDSLDLISVTISLKS